MSAKIVAFPARPMAAVRSASIKADSVAHAPSVQQPHTSSLFRTLVSQLKAWAKARAVRREQAWEMRHWTPEVYRDHNMQPATWREAHQTFWK